MDLDRFVFTYKAELTRLAGRIPVVGISTNDLDACEERLKLRLPRMLRAVYLMSGKTACIHNSYNRLVEPKDLYLFDDDTSLVFYEENQIVVRWALRLSDLPAGDPPVVQ